MVWGLDVDGVVFMVEWFVVLFEVECDLFLWFEEVVEYLVKYSQCEDVWFIVVVLCLGEY